MEIHLNKISTKLIFMWVRYDNYGHQVMQSSEPKGEISKIYSRNKLQASTVPFSVSHKDTMQCFLSITLPCLVLKHFQMNHGGLDVLLQTSQRATMG